MFGSVSAPRKTMMRSLLKAIISFGLLGWLFYRNDPVRIFSLLWSIPYFAILSAILLYFSTLFLSALRWKILIQKYKLRHLYVLTIVSQYYALVFPGQIAGEVFKAYRLGKGKQDAEQIAASVIIDRIVGMIGMLVVAIGGLFFSRTRMAPEAATILAGAILILLTVLYLFHFDQVAGALKRSLVALKERIVRAERMAGQTLRLLDAWRQYLNEPVLLLKVFFLGVLYQVLGVCISFVLAKSIHIEIAFFDWCWIFGLISVVVLLPITIGGIGVREGGFVLLLNDFGVPEEKALALSVSVFGLQLIMAILGGLMDLTMDTIPKSRQKRPSGRVSEDGPEVMKGH